MQTRSFDELMGPKAAYPTDKGNINLLKVLDIPEEGRARITQMGFGDLLRDAAADGYGSSKTASIRDQLKIDLETNDPLRA